MNEEVIELEYTNVKPKRVRMRNVCGCGIEKCSV